MSDEYPSTETRELWRKHPDQPVDVIVRVSGDLDEASARLQQRGAEVVRRYRLTHALLVRCAGKTALALLDETWVKQIEPDQPVKAVRR